MSDKYRLSSASRLRNKAAFDAVFKSRKRLNSPFGTLRFCRNELGYARLGVISSKKNVRFAVVRNRLRRVIREQFRLHQHELCGYDVVFVTHRGASSVSNSEFHQCIRHLFNILLKSQEQP
ncbi:MAG: ribonuclease P protein component [Coxiella sp. (in: Bacteria)]|nr:MAG: ribonuclease P protein component [Coxiella sp. (in: g-proteobacteria)]